MNKDSVCYIVGAGSFDEKFSPISGDYLIAADGGFDKLGGKYKIDAVLGDFDSLGRIPEHENVIRHPEMKDDTDMTLAVMYAHSLGYKKFLIFGGLGGRLDHTLANMQTLLAIAEFGGKGYLIGEGMIITAVKNGSFDFTGRESGILSIFPAYTEARGVYLENLMYPLNDAVLPASRALAVSNEFIGKKAKVSVCDGALFALWYEKFTDKEGAVYEN